MAKEDMYFTMKNMIDNDVFGCMELTKTWGEAVKVSEKFKFPIECHNTHVQCTTRGWTRTGLGDESFDSKRSDDVLRKRQTSETAVSKFWKDPRTNV